MRHTTFYSFQLEIIAVEHSRFETGKVPYVQFKATMLFILISALPVCSKITFAGSRAFSGVSNSGWILINLYIPLLLLNVSLRK